MQWKKYLLFCVCLFTILVPVIGNIAFMLALMEVGGAGHIAGGNLLMLLVGLAIIFLLSLLFARKEKKSHFWRYVLVGIISVVVGYCVMEVSFRGIQYISNNSHTHSVAFSENAAKSLPSSLQIASSEFFVGRYERQYRLRSELLVDINTKFDVNSVKYWLKFLIKGIPVSEVYSDPNYQNRSKIIPGCILKNTFFRIKNEETVVRPLPPGRYMFISEWYFYGDQCSVTALKSLEGQSIVVTDDKLNKITEVEIPNITEEIID